jgi:GTP1/Obg family GTP-binding protein
MSTYDDDIKKFDEALAKLDLIKTEVKQLKKNYISNLKKKDLKLKIQILQNKKNVMG